MSETFRWYVGIDWGVASHDVCLMDATGRVVGTRTVAHTVAAVHEAVQWMGEHTSAPDAVAVALERPRGILVDMLVEAGFAVWALNPKQLDRFRDRFTAAGAKDDRRDAQAIADGLRTDRRAFQRVRPDPPTIIQLRELRDVFEDLGVEASRLTNRLREQLYRVDAAWLTISPAANDPWLWEILAHAPHPETWPDLARRRIAAVLRAHHIRRWTPETVLAALRQPRLRAAPGVADAVATRVGVLTPQLRLIQEQRATTQAQMDRLLKRVAEAAASEVEPGEHHDVDILRSLPGIGRWVTATMLTDAAGALAERDYRTLRTCGGAAPITKRSGKRLRVVQMRYACKPRLRAALYHWARVSVQHDVPARRYYETLRQRGHSHGRALRSVADRWLRILIAMLKKRTLYDPARFDRTVSVSA